LGDGRIFGRDDFVTPHIITVGPIRRILVTHISSNDTKTIYIKTDEELEVNKRVLSCKLALDIETSALTKIALISHAEDLIIEREFRVERRLCT